jgi:hypothetical protein
VARQKRRSHPSAPLYYPPPAALLNADQIAGSLEIEFAQIAGQASDAQIPESAVTQHAAAVAGAIALDDISDVNAPTPADGDALTWDNATGKWVNTALGGGAPHALDSHTDVNAPTPADGDVLTWDSTPGEWVAAAPTGGGAAALDDLTDVDTTTNAPATDDLLVFNGTLWVPRALVAADIPNLDAAKIASGTLGTARLGSGTADGTTFLRGDQTWAAPPGGSEAYHAGTTDLEVWYAANRGNNNAPTTFSVTANNLRLLPFLAPPGGGTLDRIGFNVAANAVGVNARIGLWESTSLTNIYPETLLEDSGDISCAASGFKTYTISRTLTGGRMYWLGIVSNGSVTVSANAADSTGLLIPFSGTFGRMTMLVVAHAYAALPNPCTAGATGVTTTTPVLVYRFSA